MNDQTITRNSVRNSLKSELATMKKLSKLDEPQSHEEYREPLSVDVIKEVKILLSWGGPEDGFKLRFDNENNLINGVYYEANWGEYQEVELTEEELDTVDNFYYVRDSILDLA